MGLVAGDRLELLGVFLEFGSGHFGFLLFDNGLWGRDLVAGLEVHRPDFSFKFRDLCLYEAHFLLFFLEFGSGLESKFFFSLFFLF